MIEDFRSKNYGKFKIFKRKKRVTAELYMLSDTLTENLHEGYNQQKDVRYDTMFYSPRKKKMNNGQTRYNIVFEDERKEQYLSNYDGEQATNTIVVDHENDTLFSVEPFDELPYLSGIRAELPKILGDKAKNLNSEGNYYYYEERSGWISRGW